MQTINSGNRNVIYFIYFSSVEIDINFLAWELVICHLAGGGGVGRENFVGRSLSKSLLVLGGHLWVRDPYLGGQINKPFERGTKQ